MYSISLHARFAYNPLVYAVFLSLAGSFTGLPLYVSSSKVVLRYTENPSSFLTFVSLAYHLAGGVASERATLLTSHLRAMGALDSARIL